MTTRSLIIISAIFFSCNNRQVKIQDHDPVTANDSAKIESIPALKEESVIIPADTTSTDYLMYLLKNEKGLNDHWTKKLKELDEFIPPTDSTSHLSTVRDWVINDSISAIILNLSTGTSSDDYLLTAKNKKNIVSKLHISDEADSDVSEKDPNYYYLEYKLINDREIKLFNHEIRDYEKKSEKDIVSEETWLIQHNGKLLKK